MPIFTHMAQRTELPGYCGGAAGHPVYGPYHDHEYGFPIEDDDALFERLVLDINQAGLSWLTILKKREGLRQAYKSFQITHVAGFGARDRKRLLTDLELSPPLARQREGVA